MLKLETTKKQFEKLLGFFSQYSGSRPKPERNLDQFRATEETVLKRAVSLGSIENISQKQLLFLGDNDLTSLVFSLFYRADKITVVDIDPRILDFIEMVSRHEGFPISLIRHNLRDPLDKTVFKDYDIVFFDSPYTPLAVNTWLVRAMEATLGSGRNKKRKKPELLSSKLYLMCYGYTDRSVEKGFKIQQIISSLGLIIQEKIRGYNKYYGAESIGSQSDLYVIQPTPKVNIRQLDVARSQFYTGQRQTKSNHTSNKHRICKSL